MAVQKKVNTSFLQNLANDYKQNLNGSDAEDIISFTEAIWGLNFKLLPVQKFMLKALYGMVLDNGEPTIDLFDDLNVRQIGSFNEHDFMQYLIAERRTNLTKYEPGIKRRELILCLGRRSSKSVLASIISNFETYRLIKLGNPQAYFGFPAGQEIAVTSVATTDEQAMTLFDMIKTRGLNCSYLKDRIINRTQNYFNIQTDEDIKKKFDPSIRLLCGGAGSSGLRGKNNLIVIFDEAAFFMQGGKNSGEDIYNALTPSIASFTRAGTKTDGEGKIILLSSPFGKSGLFYDKYNQSFDNEDDMLMFQMYTAMVNPTIDSAFLKSEKRKNRESFECEFGAKFSDTITSWIDEPTLMKVVDEKKVRNERKGKKNCSYYMGIDYGGKTDGTSAAIVHREEEKIILDYAEVYYSGSSDVWDASNLIYRPVARDFIGNEIIPIGKFSDKIKELCDSFLVVDGWFDQFNGYGLWEMLKDRGLNQFRMQPMSAGLNTEIFQLNKMLISSGLLELFNHPILIPEMLLLEEEKNGCQVVVQAPRRIGFHDDISDAVTRAVFACYNGTKKTVSTKCSVGVGRGIGGGNYKTHQYQKAKQHGINPRMVGTNFRFNGLR